MKVGRKRLRVRLGPGVVGFVFGDVLCVGGYLEGSEGVLRASLLASSGLRMRGCAGGGAFGGLGMVAVMEAEDDEVELSPNAAQEILDQLVMFTAQGMTISCWTRIEKLDDLGVDN